MNKERTIIIDKSLTALNDSIAKKTEELFVRNNIYCINLMGAPGSGKTTVIECLSNFFNKKKMLIIQGDLKSDYDKVRLEKQGIETLQINTHSGCHLNSDMVFDIIKDLDLSEKEFVFIENVGNLVCPAGIKLGQDLNILVSATTEGPDKPKKYPHIFRDSQIIILSKYDIKEAVNFDEKSYLKDLSEIANKSDLFKVSSKNLESFKKIVAILIELRNNKLKKIKL